MNASLRVGECNSFCQADMGRESGRIGSSFPTLPAVIMTYPRSKAAVGYGGGRIKTMRRSGGVSVDFAAFSGLLFAFRVNARSPFILAVCLVSAVRPRSSRIAG